MGCSSSASDARAPSGSQASGGSTTTESTKKEESGQPQSSSSSTSNAAPRLSDSAASEEDGQGGDGGPAERQTVLDKARSISGRNNVASSRIIRHMTVYEAYTGWKMGGDNVLGHGVSGAVRIVTSNSTQKQVALKSLSTLNMNPKKWDMLYNEVEIYLKLDHPNICKLLEVYEDDSAVHLVMELCSGKELYDRLLAKKRYSEKDTVVCALQMLDALYYMHWHNMCHRDLKLENFCYADDSEDARLKLIDFGFSKIFSPGQPMTAMHGTVYYVAPEVLNANYSEKCDIWSVGVIVYMLLSGSPPFNGPDDNAIIRKIRGSQVKFEGSRWEGISQLAKDFITHCLQRNPDDRPNAKDAMNHEWCKQMGIPDAAATEISLECLKNLQAFASQNVIKRAACGLMAFSMTTDDMEELEAQFRKLDKQGNGTILLGELTEVLKETLNMPEQEAKRLFEKLDQTGDMEIHYSEFVAASLQSRFLQQESVIREAFRKFDIDGSGCITVDNLRQVLGDEYNGTQVEDIILAIDIKKNGVIEYDEFVQALTDIGTKSSDPTNMDIMKKLSRQLIDNDATKGHAGLSAI